MSAAFFLLGSAAGVVTKSVDPTPIVKLQAGFKRYGASFAAWRRVEWGKHDEGSSP